MNYQERALLTTFAKQDILKLTTHELHEYIRLLKMRISELLRAQKGGR